MVIILPEEILKQVENSNPPNGENYPCYGREIPPRIVIESILRPWLIVAVRRR